MTNWFKLVPEPVYHVTYLQESKAHAQREIISRKRLGAEVYLGVVNKPTTRNTRDAHDFVHAKRLTKKKLLLTGYVLYDPTHFKKLSNGTLTKVLWMPYPKRSKDELKMK